MKKQTRLIIMAVMVVSMSLAFAGKEERHGDPKQENKMVSRQLDLRQELSEEQIEQIHAAKVEFDKKAIKLKAYIKVKRIEVDEMIMDGKSAAKIGPALSEINAYTLALSKAKTEMEVQKREIVGEKAYRQMKGRHQRMQGQRPQGKRSQGQDGPRFKNSMERHGDGDGQGYRVNNKCAE